MNDSVIEKNLNRQKRQSCLLCKKILHVSNFPLLVLFLRRNVGTPIVQTNPGCGVIVQTNLRSSQPAGRRKKLGLSNRASGFHDFRNRQHCCNSKSVFFLAALE